MRPFSSSSSVSDPQMMQNKLDLQYESIITLLVLLMAEPSEFYTTYIVHDVLYSSRNERQRPVLDKSAPYRSQMSSTARSCHLHGAPDNSTAMLVDPHRCMKDDPGRDLQSLHYDSVKHRLGQALKSIVSKVFELFQWLAMPLVLTAVIGFTTETS